MCFAVFRTNTLFFFLARTGCSLGKRKQGKRGLNTHERKKKIKNKKKTRAGEEGEKEIVLVTNKSTRTKRNMFSSLSMRSALVGTSVPTTSTNSRGTRMHRSRRAKLARIPAKMHLFFFFRALSFRDDELFPLFFRRGRFYKRRCGRPRKGKSRDIAQREHRARMKVNNKILRIYFYRYAELRAL